MKKYSNETGFEKFLGGAPAKENFNVSEVEESFNEKLELAKKWQEDWKQWFNKFKNDKDKMMELKLILNGTSFEQWVSVIWPAYTSDLYQILFAARNLSNGGVKFFPKDEFYKLTQLCQMPAVKNIRSIDQYREAVKPILLAFDDLRGKIISWQS